MTYANTVNDAYNQIPFGEFLRQCLERAYDCQRFKRYARDVMASKSNRIEAANEVIWQAASKMASQGAMAGIPFVNWATWGAGAADIASLMYHIVEMCGVLAEIYGHDTCDESVKLLVLAGASGDDALTGKVMSVVALGNPKTTLLPLVKTLLVPILKALGVKVGVRGGIKTAELIPVMGGVFGGSANFLIVDRTGHAFLDRLIQNENV